MQCGPWVKKKSFPIHALEHMDHLGLWHPWRMVSCWCPESELNTVRLPFSVWNNLDEDVIQASTLTTFKSRLKTVVWQQQVFYLYSSLLMSLIILLFVYFLIIFFFLLCYATLKHFDLPCVWTVLYKQIGLALPLSTWQINQLLVSL